MNEDRPPTIFEFIFYVIITIIFLPIFFAACPGASPAVIAVAGVRLYKMYKKMKENKNR